MVKEASFHDPQAEMIRGQSDVLQNMHSTVPHPYGGKSFSSFRASAVFISSDILQMDLSIPTHE